MPQGSALGPVLFSVYMLLLVFSVSFFIYFLQCILLKEKEVKEEGRAKTDHKEILTQEILTYTSITVPYVTRKSLPFLPQLMLMRFLEPLDSEL